MVSFWSVRSYADKKKLGDGFVKPKLGDGFVKPKLGDGFHKPNTISIF